MQVRWTTAAAADLENIADYLFEKTPENAPRLIREICGVVSSLRAYPNRGRAGKKSGTRELVLPALPYIVVYKAGSEVLHIARILHGARTGHDELTACGVDINRYDDPRGTRLRAASFSERA